MKRTPPELYEEVARKIDELRKDRTQFEEYVASRIEKVLKHWPIAR